MVQVTRAHVLTHKKRLGLKAGFRPQLNRPTRPFWSQAHRKQIAQSPATRVKNPETPALQPWARARAQDQHLDLGGCGSLSALITLEQKFGARAFQLLGYARPCERDSADAPAGLRRLAGGWCRSSEKSAGHATAALVCMIRD